MARRARLTLTHTDSGAGLVAVDALALRLPVLTTAYARHAPERDHRVDGEETLVLLDRPREFDIETVRLRGILVNSALPPPSDIPSTASVAERFTGPVLSAVS